MATVRGRGRVGEGRMIIGPQQTAALAPANQRNSHVMTANGVEEEAECSAPCVLATPTAPRRTDDEDLA